MISLISCISKNFAIGKGNDLVFKISEDLLHFKHITTGTIVAMGYNTAISLPQSSPLPNRDNYVFCDQDKAEFLSSKGFIPIVGKTIHEGLLELEKSNKNKEVIVIGGGVVYKEAISVVQKMYLTIVDEVIENADVFFPHFKMEEWTVVSERKGVDDRITFLELSSH